MIITQSAATARVYAARHEQQLDENADLAGLFAANAAAGLSGTFVVNGSPTQTAMVEGADAQTRSRWLQPRPFNPPPQFFNPRHVPFWA
jgi:sulfate permease, SulP family